jgi:hypothetical protein
MTTSTTVVQRWRRGRVRWRPVGETINTREYEVAEIPDDTTAKAFVLENHYSSSYVAARHRFGLWRRGQLEGVAVFSHPVNDRAFHPFPGEPLESVELGRFVLTDRAPGNAETWCLARCFELLRRSGILGVVSFSDPVPRRALDGTLVLRGHVGSIYSGHNGLYVGRSRSSRLHLLPDGRILSPRAIQKVKAMERSWRYTVELLEAHGAPRFDVDELAGDREQRLAWLERALAATTRRFRHGGNHKYVWALDRRVHRSVIKAVAARSPNGALPPFPKQIDPEPRFGPTAASAARSAAGRRR